MLKEFCLLACLSTTGLSLPRPVPPPSAWTVQADEPLPERNDQPRLPDIGYRESRESTDSGSTRRLLELLLGTAVVVAFLVYAFLRWQAQAGRRR